MRKPLKAEKKLAEESGGKSNPTCKNYLSSYCRTVYEGRFQGLKALKMIAMNMTKETCQWGCSPQNSTEIINLIKVRKLESSYSLPSAANFLFPEILCKCKSGVLVALPKD